MKNIISKVKENVQRYREIYMFGISAIIVIGAILIMYKLDLNSKVLKYTSHISNQDELQIVHDFTSGMEIKQKFECYEDFDFITLSFSDHDQRLSGKLAVQILDVDSGEPLTYCELENTSIYYNVPVEISFEDIGGGRAGKQYEIVLMAFDTSEVALGVLGNQVGEHKAKINGEESDYSLSIGIHSYTNVYSNLTILVLGSSSISLLFVIFVVFKFKLKEEHIFLVMAIPFALCMLLMWPGNAVYDEARHVNTVYHYSNVILGCAEQDNMAQIKMRACDIIDRKELELRGTSSNAQAQDYWYYVNKMWDKTGDKTMVLVDVSKSPVVIDGSFFQYIPGIFGMTLGRILQLNYFGIMTLCRITIMAFYFAMCYWAIKEIPILKMMMVFWAALPMNLYQTSGVSYDSFTFAVGIVVFALIIKLWNEGLKKEGWIKLGIAVFALGQCKGGVYLTLILLMCFIPKKKYICKKWIKFAIMLGIAGVSMISSFLPTIMNYFIKPIISVSTPQSETVNEVVNSGIVEKFHLFYVLEDPISFTRMFIHTLIDNLDIYLGQMLGYRTAWSGDVIALVIMLPFLVLLILASVKQESDNVEVNGFTKLGILVMLLMELIGMQAIFLGETPTYSNVIVGFQGRYFILFIPCILLIFRNEGLIFKEKQEYLYPCFGMAQLVYLYFFLEMFMLA